MNNLKKVGIFGSGPVAKVIGNGFLLRGHDVMLGSRDKNKLTEWKEKGGEHAHIGSFEEVAAFGDLLVLAAAGHAAVEIIESAGVDNIKGKTIIDTTNPLSQNPPEDGVLKFFTTPDESLMEVLQNRFPEGHFVKAFNSVGNTLMVNPVFKEGKPTMFICGNNEMAKVEVADILRDFGWETADMGRATAARAIEQLCILWCIPGFLRNEWGHAFKLLKA